MPELLNIRKHTIIIPKHSPKFRIILVRSETLREKTKFLKSSTAVSTILVCLNSPKQSKKSEAFQQIPENSKTSQNNPENSPIKILKLPHKIPKRKILHDGLQPKNPSISLLSMSAPALREEQKPKLSWGREQKFRNTSVIRHQPTA